MVPINFMPHRQHRAEQGRRRFRTGLGLSSLLALAVAAVLAFMLDHAQSQQAARHAALEQAAAGLREHRAQSQRLRQELMVLEQAEAADRVLQAERQWPLALFNELAILTPDGVTLSDIGQTGTGVTLKGWAQSSERLHDFVRRLQSRSAVLHRPELREVRAMEAARLQRSDGARRSDWPWEFTLTVRMHQPATATENTR